jgi:hypothetical protein
LGLWQRGGGGEAGDELVGGAEVDGFDDFRFAVDALAVAEIVVRAAFDEFTGQRGPVS